ncbi:MAG: hypothetical protein ACOY0T_28500 [Myxococcota bacterium]
MEKSFVKALQQALKTALATQAAEVIGAHASVAQSGWLGLQERSRLLAQAAELVNKPPVKGRALAERPPQLNRDKLARLAKGDLTTTLTIQEWILLDLLLRDTGGTGLASMLHARNWVDQVVSLGNVYFSVGSRSQRFGGNDLELVFAYDLRAVTELSRHFDQRAATALDSEILYAPVGPTESDIPPPTLPAASRAPAVFETSGGRHDIETGGRPTVMIGSTATNPATEIALAVALGYLPWQPVVDSRKLPFWFAWPNGVGRHSTFSNQAVAGTLSNPARNFGFADRVFELSRDSGLTHGIVLIAKRQRPIVVVAGTTAAATYACAQKAHTINEDFPDPEHPLIAHVQAEVSFDQSLPGPEKRRLEHAEVVAIRTWDRAKRRWA